MLAVILNQADLPAGGAQDFRKGKAMLVLAVAVGIRVPGDNGCFQAVLLGGCRRAISCSTRFRLRVGLEITTVSVASRISCSKTER